MTRISADTGMAIGIIHTSHRQTAAQTTPKGRLLPVPVLFEYLGGEYLLLDAPVMYTSPLLERLLPMAVKNLCVSRLP